jgi:hypothetical protein
VSVPSSITAAAGSLAIRPASVVEGDHQRGARIVAGQRHGFVDQLQQLCIDSRAFADHSEAHAVLVQFGKVAADEPLHQSHEIVDLGGRPRPVLGREAVDRQILDAEFDGCTHGAPHGLHAHAVAHGARQAALLCPAPVAVHDDGDMSGHRHAAALPCYRLVVLVHGPGVVGIADAVAAVIPA